MISTRCTLIIITIIIIYIQTGSSLCYHALCFLILAHTPDNSLLGFVMNVNLASVNPTEKENIGVVYGKNLHQWEVSCI